MPYIKNESRDLLNDYIDMLREKISHSIPEKDLNGALNYTITRLIVECINTKYGEWRYNGINDAIGILECAKLELYRRGGGPYEDVCIEKNGDISCYV